MLVAVLLVRHAEVMPGAKMSTQVPKFENEERTSLVVVEPTVIAFEKTLARVSGLLGWQPLFDKKQGHHVACRSSTVTAKTNVPTKPMIPATMNGTSGAMLHNKPPMAAAGVIERLRTR